jgi:hypothetical protein
MRPVSLVASTLWWSVLTVFAFAYATYVDVTVGAGTLGMLVLVVLFFLSCSILWFLLSYWQGQDWTRTFVIVGLILKALYYLYQAGRAHRFPHGFDSFLSLRFVDFVFSVYMLYWLMTKEARSYFTFKARTN